MLEAFVGQSEDVLAEEAIAEVLQALHVQLEDRQPVAGILFCSIEMEHRLILERIYAAFPSIALIGCTTDGEICSDRGFSDDSVVLLVFVSDTVEIRSGLGCRVSIEGTAAGKEAAAGCVGAMRRPQAEHRFAVVLSDPISAGTSGVDLGIQSVLGRSFPVFGGVSAAHSKQRKTLQFHDREVVSDSVVLLLFAGPVSFSCGIKGGHAALGLREKVVSSDRNILYRIGDATAYDYFRRYVGDYDLFMNYCLAVFPDASDNFYVLSAPSSDAATGAVMLNGLVPENAEVQIGTASKNVVAASCAASIDEALLTFPGDRICGGLLFSCAGRKMIMGTKIVQESDIVRERLAGVPVAGFYCYGEYGPPAAGEPFRFHGTTFVTLLFGEATGAAS